MLHSQIWLTCYFKFTIIVTQYSFDLTLKLVTPIEMHFLHCRLPGTQCLVDWFHQTEQTKKKQNCWASEYAASDMDGITKSRNGVYIFKGYEA